MEPKEVYISVGVTKNMGNYEFLRVDYGIRVSLDPTETWSTAIDRSRKAIHKKLDKDMAEHIEWMRGGR